MRTHRRRATATVTALLLLVVGCMSGSHIAQQDYCPQYAQQISRGADIIENG